MQSIKGKYNPSELIKYASALFILAAVIYNHRRFLLYAARRDVIFNINPADLFYNLVFVPVMGIFFLLCFHGLGKLLKSILCENNTDKYYENLISLALGIGSFNLIVFVFAALNIVSPVSVLSLLALGILLNAKYFKMNSFRLLFHAENTPAANSWNPVLLLIAGIGVFYALISALCPATSWDALAYHLPIAEAYSNNQGLLLIPSMIMKQCSIGMEMLSTAGLSLGVEALPQVFSLFTEILSLYALFLFAKKEYSYDIAYLSVALFAIMPVSLSVGGVTNNDFSVCLFSFLAVLSFTEYVSARNSSWLYLTAAFCGFAITAKMTAIITLTWLFFSFIYITFRDKDNISGKTLAKALLILLLLGSAPYIRNFTWTGNPVFPYLSAVFKGNDPDRLHIIKKIELEIKMTEGVKASLLNFLKLPYYLITKQERYQQQPRFFVISALIIFLFRLVYTRKPFSFLEQYLMLFALYFFAAWFWTGPQQWRYSLIALPFMILLLAKWWAELDWLPVKIMLGLALSINFIPMYKWNVNNQLFGALALPSIQQQNLPARDRYLGKSLEYYGVYKYINDNLPQNSKILLFREIRGYYLKKPYIWGDPINQSVIMYSKLANSRELLDKLNSLNVTHIVVNENAYPPSPYYYDNNVMQLMGGLLSEHASLLYTQNRVQLYELKAKHTRHFQ